MTKVIIGTKAINAGIARFAVNAGKLNDNIHSLALSVMVHANKHGDCTLALALAKAMPASMRRTMLIRWFAAYSPIAVKLGDSEAIGFNARYMALKNDDAKAKAWNIADADAKPFYVMADEVAEEAAPLDFAAALRLLQSLGKRFQKRLDDDTVAANDKGAIGSLVVSLGKLTVASTTTAPKAAPKAKAAGVGEKRKRAA